MEGTAMRTGKRIVWTADERGQVIEKAVEICRQHAKMPIFHAVGQAQQFLLPPYRQRKWLTKATLGSMIVEIEKELNKPKTLLPAAITAPLRSTDLEQAVRFADDQAALIEDSYQQCILWRGLVTGFLAGRQP